MLEKKIALLTSVTFNNIGNGFIDLGAEAALMKALPLNAELFKVSSNANFAATMGLMTRDSLAYKYYANFTKNSYNGIDNVFFVNLLNLPQIDTDLTPYVVLNIEEPKHYRIKEELKNIFKEKNIVYSYHKPFPYTKVSKLVKNGVIVSDNPMDYLLLYRNASEVYSDRVHACIPTLAFGNKARLFSNSPRIALFENAKIPDVRERLVSIEGLKEMQDKQIAFLASLLQ